MNFVHKDFVLGILFLGVLSVGFYWFGVLSTGNMLTEVFFYWGFCT